MKKALITLLACASLSSCTQTVRCTTTQGAVLALRNTTDIEYVSGDKIVATRYHTYLIPANQYAEDTLTVTVL
ncbi:hypothetical protein [Hymenobacter siberiensis]|uniref:hypothetical protein n=1 Tax=Hymenobacter siberiensis TaxID=2848396 RepID=UPI001C1E2FC6|nr:hypothetical protein [Hymenobacter siberiensis]